LHVGQHRSARHGVNAKSSALVIGDRHTAVNALNAHVYRRRVILFRERTSEPNKKKPEKKKTSEPILSRRALGPIGS
jgi:hypothetical protein